MIKCERCGLGPAKLTLEENGDVVNFCVDCYKKELQPQAGGKRLGNFLTNILTNQLGERLMKA